MKRHYLILSLALHLMAVNFISAQKFLEPSFTYSGKKISYLTMEDGTEVQVYVKKLKFEKGLIEEMKIENEKGEKVKIKPEQIRFMYLPQSGWDKFTQDMDFLTDAQKWDNKELKQERFADGYVYFEQAKVKLKKETLTLMMQLLNPSFSSKVKVYHDPYAKETAAFGVGGITLAGGDAKSYYVKVGEGTAFKLEKKNYDEELDKLYGDCREVKTKIKKDTRWSDFEEHVYEHSKACE